MNLFYVDFLCVKGPLIIRFVGLSYSIVHIIVDENIVHYVETFERKSFLRWYIYSQKSTIKNSSNILSTYAKHKILYPMCRINQREELFKCSRYRLVATDSFTFWRYINVHRLRFFDNVHDLLNFKVHQTKENYVGMCNVFINVIIMIMHWDFFSWLYFLADNI